MGSLNLDLDEKRNHQGHYANTQNISAPTTHAYCFNRLKLYVKKNSTRSNVKIFLYLK